MKKNNLFILPTPTSPEKSEVMDRGKSKVIEFPKPKVAVNRALRNTLFEKALEAEKLGNTEEEAGFYRQIVEMDPNYAGAWVNLGTIAFYDQKWEAAESCYRKAIEVDPRYALALYSLGSCLDTRGRKKEAEEYYLRALAVNPGYLNVHYNLALLYQESARPQQALHHWRFYIKSAPEDARCQTAMREETKLKKAYED